MKAREFDSKAGALLQSEHLIAAARRVLVKGESMAGVARDERIDRAQLSRAVKKLREREVCPCCGQAT
jgi:DNA-binding phage protein